MMGRAMLYDIFSNNFPMAFTGVQRCTTELFNYDTRGSGSTHQRTRSEQLVTWAPSPRIAPF